MHISQQKSIDKHHKYDDIKGLLEQTAATKNSQKKQADKDIATIPSFSISIIQTL